MNEYKGIKVGDVIKVGDHQGCEVYSFFNRGDKVQISYIQNGALFSCEFDDIPIVKTPMTIKFSKEVSEFIEANAAISNEDLPDKWYWFPRYYRKVGEGLFEVTEWKDLPSGLKRIIEQSEPRSEKEECIAFVKHLSEKRYDFSMDDALDDEGAEQFYNGFLEEK